MFPFMTLTKWSPGMFLPPLLTCNAMKVEHHSGLCPHCNDGLARTHLSVGLLRDLEVNHEGKSKLPAPWLGWFRC